MPGFLGAAQRSDDRRPRLLAGDPATDVLAEYGGHLLPIAVEWTGGLDIVCGVGAEGDRSRMERGLDVEVGFGVVGLQEFAVAV
ncbi:hypothetical protein GALLR39Z86_50100 [Glycomyces algeriensis]|uniref:Uncharacterized protein n=1 Tax=Glycomyces algeriensis TaxID=256037 RepID=A0A9W6GE21_9ACTN|nr:hypothetical protein GALLR39Z86_50100 [Glycomyces algeriensis]